jgi:hypothetical protein
MKAPAGELRNPMTGESEPAWDCVRCGERRLGFQMDRARSTCKSCSSKRGTARAHESRTVARAIGRALALDHGAWRRPR